MEGLPTTEKIRAFLEEMGAVKPGRRAVAMIAVEVSKQGEMTTWNLRYSDATIKTAVEACKGLKGEASYTAFATALQSASSPQEK
jgi:hypothetical protein